MAKKISQSDPALDISFFTSGFYTYRSELFAPFRAIGVNVVSFHDPVIDGANFELTDKLQWTRRPGFSQFCPISLPDNEIVNQFYSSRNLNGTVFPFVDTTIRLAVFSPTDITTIISKTTTNQGYIATIGNFTYFSDGVPADASVWDGQIRSAWGLAAPTTAPIISGKGFWQPFTTYALGDTILDPNGDIEVVSSILIPNGAFETPNTASNLALGGSLPLTWAAESVYGGYAVTEGYRHIQQAGNTSMSDTVSVTLPLNVTIGNVLILNFGYGTLNFVPSVVSVTDSLGNTYTQQVDKIGDYAGGGGNHYYSNNWIYSTPVTFGGACTVTVQTSGINSGAPGVQLSVHEVSGIGDTVIASAAAFGVNFGSLDTGNVGFSGTQLVFSSLLLFSTGPGITPPAYIAGGSSNIGQWQLRDAYVGVGSPADPTWDIPAANGQAVGISAVFPITSLAAGYTPYLFFSDFNCVIPVGATIVGIKVTIPRFNAGTGTVQDNSVRLVIGGVVVGTDEATAIDWSTAGYEVVTYGGPTDLWGLTPTPADINTNGLSGFGVAVSAKIVDTSNGSIIPEIGFLFPNQPTVTVFYKQANGFGGPGISGPHEPSWSTSTNGVVNDGGLTWTNYGPIQTWFPVTGYPTPVVILDINGNLQLSTYIANPVPAWDVSATYSLGQVVFFGGQYWLSVLNGANTGVVPSINYTLGTPVWALTSTPLVTGITAPVWNTTKSGTTTDGSYTWINIGQGVGLAFMGYAYVYGYRTVYGHLTTSSPFSQNTGAILGPLNGSITSFTISSNIVTFTGQNNFQNGNVFKVSGLSTGTYLNGQSLTVLTSVPSATFPLTAVEIDGSDVLTITAANNLSVGQTVSFSGVGTATFLNGVTVTVLASGLSSSQFQANFAHGAYGPTDDSGNVNVDGSYTANFTHSDVSLTLDSGLSTPLIATVSGVGTGSPLCNSVASITAISVSANVVTITASNNFQPGLWVTFDGLVSAVFLTGQQLQVISVDQPVGTQNTSFQVFFETPNYLQTADSGTATFNAVEIYRLSDGGGTYLFDGAVTNPGAGINWTYNDFVIDEDLDELLIAPLSHQNDPPPGVLGSSINNTGTVMVYWQGRLWMIVGNYVYFDAGPDCINGIPEQSWPPANRFQFAGPVMNLEPTADGVGLLVYLADRVNAILGGPETISFYATDALSNFGIANPNAIFRDGSTIGQFTTQQQYIDLIDKNKQETGEHIADYLTTNFAADQTYVTFHRNGLDVGIFLSNGVDRIVRYGSNVSAWSVPAFPAFGAGAVRSIETSVGIHSLMAASPTGGLTTSIGLVNPLEGESVGTGTAWVDPTNITIGNPTTYATVTFSGAGSSKILRASDYVTPPIPRSAVVQGIQVVIVGKQSDISGDLTLTIIPTNAEVGATSHTFSFGTSNTTITFGGPGDLWGMSWADPDVLNDRALGFDIVATFANSGTPDVNISEVQVSVTYQNPGNYLYARDLNSWGDGGTYGANNGTPYTDAYIVIGSITLSQLGAPLFPLQHVVGYFDAVGILNNGAPSQPNIWIMPNEINTKAGIGFIQLPEVVQEPPTGQNEQSASILALRWPCNMMNSTLASQFIHHLQVKIEFESENAPNTIKGISFKENQD